MGTLLLSAFACLIATSCSHESPPPDPQPSAKATPVVTVPPLDGLWIGSWGGGGSGEVIMQPVLAELLIDGDRVETDGFPEIARFSGIIHIDEATHQLQVIEDAEEGAAKRIVIFRWQLDGDRLTLTDPQNRPVLLARSGDPRPSPGSLQVELVLATELSESGNLTVSHTRSIESRRGERKLHRQHQEKLGDPAVMFLMVEDSGARKLTIEEARQHLKKPAIVAVTTSRSVYPPELEPRALWKDAGLPALESESIGQTLSRSLRAGTLVVVIPPMSYPAP